MSLDCVVGLYYGVNLGSLSLDKTISIYSLLDSRNLSNKFNKVGLKNVGYSEADNCSLILYSIDLSIEISTNNSDYILNIDKLNSEQKTINEFTEQLAILFSEINLKFIEPKTFLALEY